MLLSAHSAPTMTADLFQETQRLERIPLPDAQVYYLRELALHEPAGALLNKLVADTPWRSESILVRGRRYPQPRLVAWYGDAGKRYAYSGLQFDPLPWTPTLSAIKRAVEAIAGVDFNSVLINYYRDQADSMGLHSDDEPELGRRPIIASVSLGEERTFILKHKTRRDLKPVRLKLASGSLLLMCGETQHCWRHGIGKEARPCGPRVNLTFRRIVD